MLLPFSLDPNAEPPSGGPASEPPPSAPRTGTRLTTLHDTRDSRPSPEADPEKLRAVFAAAPLPIVALDPTGRVTLWNPAAEAAFGWTAAEAVGRLAPEEFVELCARALGGETLTSVAISPRDRAGETLEARVSIAPLKTSRGDVSGVVAIYSVSPRP